MNYPSTNKSRLHEEYEAVCDRLRWGWLIDDERRRLIVRYFLLKALLEAYGEQFMFEY